MLFVPLALGILGFTIQRKLGWGMPVAVWTLVALAPVIFFATVYFGEYVWADIFSAFTDWSASIIAIIGVPWIIGALIGRKRLTEAHENA